MDVLNKEYLPMLDQLKKHFQENGQISLQKILTPKAYTTLQKLHLEFQETYELMSHRYKQTSVPKEMSTLLSDELFTTFLKELTGRTVTLLQGEVRNYQHQDFSLRKNCTPGIILTLDIGNDFPEECGGDLCFAMEEDTAIVPSSENTLSLIHVDEFTEEFLTYITHHATGLQRTTIFFHIK